MSWIHDYDAPLMIDREQPTNSWDCGRCGRLVERFRGQGDVTCSCGAEYNASGQRLRDNWRDNPSCYDDEIGDMEGYEIACLRSESGM